MWGQIPQKGFYRLEMPSDNVASISFSEAKHESSDRDFGIRTGFFRRTLAAT
jgi:hypothetical protein